MPPYPDSPTPISYAAGLADFSPLGNLATDFFQGAENKRKYDVARTFQGGLPRDEAGNIDFNRAAEMLATRGDASQLVPLANIDLQRKVISGIGRDVSAAFPTGTPSSGTVSTPGSYFDKNATVESGNNPYAKNPNSSASGPNQFTDATWLENFDKTFPQAAGLTADRKLAIRDNPQFAQHQRQVMQTFTAGNEAALRSAGIPINDTTRYGAHFFGAGDAPKVFKAPAETPLASIVQPETLQANPFLQGMTAGQARVWLAQKMPAGEGGGASAYAPPERPVIPAHGIPQGEPEGAPRVAGPNGTARPDAEGVYGADAVMMPPAPVRVAGPATAAVASSTSAPGPAIAPPASDVAVAPLAPGTPPVSPTPAMGTMPAALRPFIPPQYSDPLQFVNVLRRLQTKYESIGLTGGPAAAGANATAKSFGAQADKLMDLVGKYYELTPEQKNAMASGGLTPLQFEGGKSRASAEAKNLELTPQAKNFMMDRRPGESLADYETRLSGSKKYAEDEAARFGKKYDAITKAGQEASVELPQLQLAKSILNDPKFYSGPAEGVNLAYKRILATIDPSQADAAQPQEAFRKVISNSILSQIRSLAGTGQIRVAEIRIMEKAAANQENTPAANRLLVDIAARLHQHALGLDDLARNYNGGRLDPGFDTAARQWNEQHPLFTPAELKDPRLIAPPIFNTPADVKKAGLPKGAPFQTPDGRVKYVP